MSTARDLLDKKVDRREIFQGVANAIAKTGKKIHWGMLIDLRKCTGCHACSVACKAEFSVPLGEYRSSVDYIEKGEFPDVSRHFLPRLCNNCDKPACVSVCPTGATWKREEDGIVVIDPDVCIGCKYCVHACPYEARFINPVTGSADKCDFCLHRVLEGQVPACVEACNPGARIFGDLNDPKSKISRMIATEPVQVLLPEQGTSPQVFYIAAERVSDHDNQDGTYRRRDTHRRERIERR